MKTDSPSNSLTNQNQSLLPSLSTNSCPPCIKHRALDHAYTLLPVIPGPNRVQGYQGQQMKSDQMIGWCFREVCTSGRSCHTRNSGIRGHRFSERSNDALLPVIARKSDPMMLSCNLATFSSVMVDLRMYVPSPEGTFQKERCRTSRVRATRSHFEGRRGILCASRLLREVG